MSHVLERPDDVSDESVADAVRQHWHPGVDSVEHLAVGWGAHHWRAWAEGEPVLFVTLDPPTDRHTAASLEGAYASAAALGLDFVWPSLPQLEGSFTLPFAGRTLSVTGWLDGERPAVCTPDLPDLLGALHRAPVPPGAPVWTSEIDPELAARLADLLAASWDGPLGAAARSVLAEHMSQVTGWFREHTMLKGRVASSSYVVTHGEPGLHNQWHARGRTWLIDWESLRLAPRERDLATLVHTGIDADGDPAMVRLFDLEWRLSEIWSFARWLQGPHEGHADDRTALAGLTDELTRPHFDER
jgi:spectinomycin phosphotransferase